MPKLLSRELSNAKAAYWIGKNARVLDVEITKLEKTRRELVFRLGVEDVKNKKWDIPDKNKDEFNKKFDALMETEVEINITLIDIDTISDAKLSPIDTVSIDFMLKEGSILDKK
jgi:hypothetical protein